MGQTRYANGTWEINRLGPGGTKPETDDHELLAVRPGRTVQELRAAFKARMKEFHPDTVANIHPKFRAFAHLEFVAIQAAYERLLNQRCK